MSAVSLDAHWPFKIIIGGLAQGPCLRRRGAIKKSLWVLLYRNRSHSPASLRGGRDPLHRPAFSDRAPLLKKVPHIRSRPAFIFMMLLIPAFGLISLETMFQGRIGSGASVTLTRGRAERRGTEAHHPCHTGADGTPMPM